MAFPPFGNFYHIILVSIDFPANSKGYAPSHHSAYDYWDGLCVHMRDVPWEDIFKLGASAAANEFFERVQVGIDVCIPHKNHFKPHFSP